jgi:lysophospholipase L1-like esterase
MTHWLDKLWSGTTVYEEPVCFSQAASSESTGGSLLFNPTRILRVTSPDGTQDYAPVKDYEWRGNQLIRTVDSSIPFLSRSLYCLPYKGEADTGWLRFADQSKYCRVFPEITDYQVLVTYQHNNSWSGCIPGNQMSSLPLTLSKLIEEEPLRLVFYGDSITAGWEASGYDETVIDMITLKTMQIKNQIAPNMPAWAELVTAALKTHYHHNELIKINRAAGGSTSAWGKKNAGELVNSKQPDFVILAFGMNNMQQEPVEFKEDILDIIATIRLSNPNCEFLLVSSMIPNPEIQGFMKNKLPDHEQCLFQIQSSHTGIAVAPIHSIFLELLKRKKHYLELSGNCINHPNDFSIRIYAQTILSCLGI